MNCPNCGGTLLSLPASLFGGEALQQCASCGRLWDEEELSQAEEVGPAEEVETHFERLESFQQSLRPRLEEDWREYVEEQEAFVSTELTNEELQDDHDVAGTEEDDIEEEDEPEEVTYEDIEEDQNPYDWMGA